MRTPVTSKGVLTTGVASTLVAALCCATPVLAVVLGALGLSAWLAWADYVILPLLIAGLALTGYALYRWRPRDEGRA
jgi:mercuric ion transport protein